MALACVFAVQRNVSACRIVHVICVRDLSDGRPKLYPDYNYLSGTGLSTVWMGHGHYAPHNRQWQRHDAKRALPNDRVAGQIEFTSEDQWRDWQLKRDQHDSKYCGGYGKFSHSLPY